MLREIGPLYFTQPHLYPHLPSPPAPSQFKCYKTKINPMENLSGRGYLPHSTGAGKVKNAYIYACMILVWHLCLLLNFSLFPPL